MIIPSGENKGTWDTFQCVIRTVTLFRYCILAVVPKKTVPLCVTRKLVQKRSCGEYVFLIIVTFIGYHSYRDNECILEET